MSIRFAAARGGYPPAIANCLRARAPFRTANDNYVGLSNDKVLKAALRHFAEHGLAAAERARENAEQAFFDGDRTSYRWWLSICHTLDRRMASAIDAHTRAANDASAAVTPDGKSAEILG